MIKKLLLSSVLVLSVYGDSCWSGAELAEFAQDEFNEIARFSLKDAVSCEPIEGAKFTLGSKTYTTNEQGEITVALPDDDADKSIPIKIEKEDYITAQESVMSVFGSYWNTLFLISKDLPIESARFALSWDKSPSDLDLHLKSDNFHISFRKTKNIQNKVQLDRDAMKGYGPETITLDKLDKTDTYKVLVGRYSNGSINTKTQVRVYLNNKLDNVVKMKKTKAKCIEIATITNNIITYETKELENSACK